MFIQTDNLTQIATELNDMLRDCIVETGIFVPVNKNTIRYKNYLISRDKDNSWNVKTSRGRIYNTFLKLSAFAICKLDESSDYTNINNVINYDKIFEKNYTDATQYKYIIKHSKDEVTQDVVLWRYEMVTKIADQAKRKIKRIFYMQIA